MECVILNVLQNAARFAKHSIRVELSTTADEFQIKIEDDGPGIPEEERARVLESFVRLNNDINLPASGFGLGLAIVKRVMKWHDGDVEVLDSNLGGACMYIHWPQT